MDNFENYDTNINIPSSQGYRYDLKHEYLLHNLVSHIKRWTQNNEHEMVRGSLKSFEFIV
jgi:hypothetical protein